MKNYQIKISEKLYNECWEELYYTNLVDHIEDYTKQNLSSDFNLEQLNFFCDNNISRKKIGKGSQIIFKLNNVTDTYITEMMLLQTENYTKIHYEEYYMCDAPYPRNIHKKHLKILKDKFQQIRNIRNEYKVS